MNRAAQTVTFAALSFVLSSATAFAISPFAATVISHDPAPGQFVNDPLLNDPTRALGAPVGNSPGEPDNTALVTLGGFGGSIVLAFDHTVRDDPANPFGLDAIVYGNAFWVSGDPNRRWAEAGVIEISRDTNSNGLADDAWYLIPGSHITDPNSQFTTITWDDDIPDTTYPPADGAWLPPGSSGQWTTDGFLLPAGTFNVLVLENPNGPAATTEGVYGYADLSPTQPLPTGADADVFYARPDDPLTVSITPGSGGGDAFDIAWAIDPSTGQPANLDGFDFVRITTGVDFVAGILGETSTEISAVADVAEGQLGDADGDGDIDLTDYAVLAACLNGPGVSIPTSPCRVVDMDQDRDVDLRDVATWTTVFTGAMP